jgi:hypothetical protein
MTSEPREPNADTDADASELSKLFERSAPALDALAQGRLRAVAREIPERSGTLSRFPGWRWAAGLLALSAAGALVLVGLRRAPSAEPSATQSRPPGASQARALDVAATEVTKAVDDIDEVASSFDFDDDPSAPDVLDDLALDPGDLADSEVDAWISAANTTLGS